MQNFLLFSVCSAARGSEQPEYVLAIIKVNVIPMDRERIMWNQTVIIRDSRIHAMGPGSTVKVPDSAEVIDGRGKCPMPGLADMIMVEANPLEEVGNAAKRVGVMVRGRWYSESDLQTRLEALAKKYRDAGTRSKGLPPEWAGSE